MTNKDIAEAFQLLGNLMELQGENPFKIRSYHNAYNALRKLEPPLADMSDAERSAIPGIGKAINEKIKELIETGKMATLERYASQTPEGIQAMLGIKGFGPKKVMAIWKDLGVESVGELLYAVNENRLLELKGFGAKTQEDLRQKLTYYQQSQNRFHYAALADAADVLLAQVQALLPQAPVSLTGAIRRKANELEAIELLVGSADLSALAALFPEGLATEGSTARATTAARIPVLLYTCTPQNFGSKLFRYSAAPAFMDAFMARFPEADFRDLPAEADLFAKVQLPYIAPEMREQDWALDLAKANALPDLITDSDVRGVVHAHSTWSDGLHSLRDMALAARSAGYEYLCITDHSASAFYANGLKEDRVLAQWAEIDQLNQELAPFRIFKGIESDILNDGRLDYPDDILRGFDLIIASVHSNLRMDEDKATQRLITAIENPHTTVLGHPTGRLLLSRKGYPIDHPKVIDACAANGVAIEMNANPWRLDIDWSWIPYALEKGVPISINPDAHSTQGIRDIRFGIASARKGGLSAAQCFNACDAATFAQRIGR